MTKGSTHVSMLVHAPVDATWAAFRGFGESTLAFWSSFEAAELEGEDEVGVVRKIKTKARVIWERLDERDDEQKKMVYSFVRMEPNAGMVAASTTVTMTPAADDVTSVTFDCDFEVANSALVDAARSGQEVAYACAIKGLDRLLNPIVGDLRVGRLHARHLPRTDRLSSADAFVRVSVLDSAGRTLDEFKTGIVNNSSNPSWLEEAKFQVGQHFARLRFEVYDNDCLSREDLIFGGEIGVDEIRRRIVDVDADDTDDANVDAGETRFSLLQKEGDDSGPRLEFVVGFILREGKAIENISMVSFLDQQRRALRFVSSLEEVKRQVFSSLATLFANPHHEIEFGRLKFMNLDTSKMPGVANVIPIDRMLKPERWGLVVSRIIRGLYCMTGQNKRMEDLRNRWISFFNPDYIPMPPTVQRLSVYWKDDAEFCRQFFQGINPFQVTVVGSLDEVPEDMRVLETLDEAPVNVETLIEEKRLLVANYDLLEGLPDNPLQDDGCYRNAAHPEFVYYAPWVLLYRSDEVFSSGHNLKVLGIQLTRFSDRPNEVFTPKSPPNKWLYAKIIVQNADAHMMQFVNHLGLGHLSIEPVAIAYHNWVWAIGKEAAAEIPVLQMLKPHMDNAVGINWLARQTLILDRAPLTDRFFSTGTLGGVRMFERAAMRLDYADMCFRRGMSKRGFGASAEDDGFQGFYYRDDGLQLWDALTKYSSSAVEATYADDDAVAADEHLQKFVSDLGDPMKGNMNSFRRIRIDGEREWDPLKIDSRESLTELLTCFMYQASAFHAVQNNAQFDYMSFVPNKPQTLKMPMPLGTEEDLEMKAIMRAMPGFVESAFQAIVTFTICPVTNAPIGKVDALKELLPEAHTNLMSDFEGMKSTILSRNEAVEAEDGIGYAYFDPDVLNASVDI